MSQIADIKWFKAQFGDKIRASIAGTPFTVDLIVAIAVQESHEVWGRAYKTHKPEEVLALCVGDIIDASGGRGAFPKTRAALEAVPDGKQMFKIARAAIEQMATVATEYKKYLRNPNKFAHAFGVFQNDIQAFIEPGRKDFFLQQQWRDFDKCLARCIEELEEKRQHVFGNRTDLSRDDLVYVAIAYNKGSARVGAGFKQGFKSDGKFYGELIDQYMRMSAAA